MATYTKSALIKELTQKCGVKRKEVIALLDAVFEIACREAKADGFTFPGLCKIDTTRRKARRMRNPQTGRPILIAEHEAPRIRILKKAKEAITEQKPHAVIPLDESGSPETASKPAGDRSPPPPAIPFSMPQAPAGAETSPAVPAADARIEPDVTAESEAVTAETGQQEEPKEEAPESDDGGGIVYDDFSEAVSFKCQACGGEIEAPAAAAGLSSECPVCGEPVVIPTESEPGTIHGPKAESGSLDQAIESVAETAFSEASTLQKNQTIRIDLSTLDVNAPEAPKPQSRIVSFFCKNCNQELEAPAEMMGIESECPECGAHFEVPFFSDPGTLHGSDLEKSVAEKAGNMHNRTIRIEMPDF